MKLHWGHKIGIVYTLFAGFMISMVLISRTAKHELVTENYYENELIIQDRIEANSNLNAAVFDVDITSSNKEILLIFSGLTAGTMPIGSVYLYKPDDSSLDQTIDMHLDGSNKMRITPRGDHGRYTVSVNFNIDGIDYYKEKRIVL